MNKANAVILLLAFLGLILNVVVVIEGRSLVPFHVAIALLDVIIIAIFWPKVRLNDR